MRRHHKAKAGLGGRQRWGQEGGAQKGEWTIGRCECVAIMVWSNSYSMRCFFFQMRGGGVCRAQREDCHVAGDEKMQRD